MVNRRNLIIGFCIILSILMIIAPIYFYWKDFHHLNRSTNPADWGTFGDYFGGVLNPILSLLTLIVTVMIAVELKIIEDRKQEREISATYEPQIVVEDAIFFTYPSKHWGIEMPIEFSRESKEGNFESNLRAPNMLGIDIYNIGLGPAKDITFTYNCNEVQLISSLNQIFKTIKPERIIETTYSKEKNGKKIAIKFPQFMARGDSYLYIPDDDEIKKTHLLSANIVNKPFTISLPIQVIYLYAIYLYACGERMHTEPNIIFKFPKIDLTINYNDIGANTFKKNFRIELSFLYGGVSEFVNKLDVEEITNA